MFTLNIKGRLMTINKPVVMGILNLTPDSFYSGSRVQNEYSLLSRAEAMIEDGAAILDIGGQSTRPNSQRVDAEEEMRRVLPAIEQVCGRFPQQAISIDTYYEVVAVKAVEAGAGIVNDISAGSLDPALLPSVARLGVPYILTHMKGEPQHMQKEPGYRNVVLEVFDFLNMKLDMLKATGINDIIVDPGFGFGKTPAHNFALLKNLSWFKQLNRPVMAGLSRKATIYKTLGISAEEALNGTTVLHTIALQQGALILRAHDVKEALEAIQLCEALKGEEQQ